MAKITGAQQYIHRLRSIASEQTKAAIGEALYEGGLLVERTAKKSLTDGGEGSPHRPSAPGTPPNSDTGFLANSIHTERDGPMRVLVIASTEYAAAQEYGATINHPGGTPYFIDDDTGHAVFVSKDSPGAADLPKTKPHTITLPERPYMRPALQQNRKRIAALVRSAMRKVIGKR